jgi:capsular polysaccharide biosynthesis protein
MMDAEAVPATLPMSIMPIAVRDLLEPEARALHGVHRADVLIPAGQYRRRPPTFVETTHLQPRFAAPLAAYHEAVQQRYDPLRHILLRGALVAGQGSVVTAAGGLVRESALEFLAHGRTPDGLAGEPDAELRLAIPATRHIERPSVLVKRPWWRNFGHWLVDGAALVALLSLARLPTTTQLVIGAQESEDMRAVVADTLAAIAPAMPVVAMPDDEAWSFAALHYVTPVHVPPACKLPESIACLRAMMLRNQLTTRLGGQRIFVTRAAGATRRLENQAELLAVAGRHGFEAVELEALPMAEKLRRFHEAEIVAGVKGAGLANMVFCRPTASAIVLSSGDFIDPFFWDIAGQGMRKYAEVFGPLVSSDLPQSHNSFWIDPAYFEAALAAVA